MNFVQLKRSGPGKWNKKGTKRGRRLRGSQRKRTMMMMIMMIVMMMILNSN